MPAAGHGNGLGFVLFRNPNYRHACRGSIRRNRLSKPSFDPRPFIGRAGWTFATSVADKPNWSHEYVVESKHEGDPDFRRFVKLIADEGYVARFEGARYRYLRVDAFLYWTSRSLWSPGQNLNRRPVADVEGQTEHEQTRLA